MDNLLETAQFSQILCKIEKGGPNEIKLLLKILIIGDCISYTYYRGLHKLYLLSGIA